MNTKSVLTFLAIGFRFTFCQAQQINHNNLSYADSMMKANYPVSKPGAVLLIAKDGRPVFKKAYGMASLELSVLNKPENLFAIGSMTKQFTAVAILRLEQQGLLSLSDDMTKYLPDFNTRGTKITIENLLTHTSGLPQTGEIKDFKENRGKKENVEYDANEPLLFNPGTNWSYSNTGYFLLGLIIEKVSGIGYEAYLKQNIFDPLGMTHTSLGTHAKVIPQLANGYDPVDAANFMPTPYYSWSWPFAAGAIISNVNDLLKWDEALYSNKIVSQKELDKAFSSYKLNKGQLTNYGFGWAINHVNNRIIMHHGGDIGGYLSYAVTIPSEHLYIAILSNNTGVNPGKITMPVALKLAGLMNFAIAPKIKLSSNELKDYTGVFEVNRIGGRILKNVSGEEKRYRYVTLSQDTLFMQLSGEEKIALSNRGKDEFYDYKGSSILDFHRDTANKIVSVEVANFPVNFGPTDIGLKTNLPLHGEREKLVINREMWKNYVGKYDFEAGYHTVITIEQGNLFAETAGQGKFQLLPETVSRFSIKEIGGSVVFLTDEKGVVKGFEFSQAGNNMEAKKVE